jgi:hypothetical protein
MRRLAPLLLALTIIVAACESTNVDDERGLTSETSPDADGIPGETEARLACDAIDEYFQFPAKNRRDITDAERDELFAAMTSHAGRAAKESATWDELQQGVSDYIAYSEVTALSSDEDLQRADDALRSMRIKCEKASA